MRILLPLCLALIVVACGGVSDQQKRGLDREIREVLRSVESESAGFGSEEEQVENFIKRRTEEFAKLRASLKEALGDSDKLDNLDHFYMQGLLDEIVEKGENMSLEKAKRMTLKRVAKLQTRVKNL